MEVKVLSQEELQEVKKIQQERTNLIEQFGILEFNLQDLKNQKQKLITELNILKQKETEIGSNLQKKIWYRNNKYRKRRIHTNFLVF